MKSWILIFLFAIINGCKTSNYYKNEYEKVSEVYNSWKYKELASGQKLKVLLFNKKVKIDLMTYSNFLIGINPDGDTIAIIDKEYQGDLYYKNDLIIDTCKWTPYEKEMINPLLTVSSKKEYNDFYLSIDTVFYGCIMPN